MDALNAFVVIFYGKNDVIVLHSLLTGVACFGYCSLFVSQKEPWRSGRVLDSRRGGGGEAVSSLTGVTALYP